jgi:predicted nucleic acid-binding protein
MATLIDTSVLIDVERGRLTLNALLDRHGDDEVAISAITAAELLHGIHRLGGGAKAARAEIFVEGLLTVLPILPFDLLAARTHARLSADLQAKGLSIGAHDLLIAATAIANDFRVMTRDLRSFPKVRGLEIVRV